MATQLSASLSAVRRRAFLLFERNATGLPDDLRTRATHVDVVEAETSGCRRCLGLLAKVSFEFCVSIIRDNIIVVASLPFPTLSDFVIKISHSQNGNACDPQLFYLSYRLLYSRNDN